MHEFIRIATAVNPVAVGDPVKNAEDVCKYIAKADENGCDVVVFPELALTGYTCADLFFQNTLLDESMKGLQAIMACSAAYPGVTAVVGTPAVVEGQMYNCAAVISAGEKTMKTTPPGVLKRSVSPIMAPRSPHPDSMCSMSLRKVKRNTKFTLNRSSGTIRLWESHLTASSG